MHVFGGGRADASETIRRRRRNRAAEARENGARERMIDRAQRDRRLSAGDVERNFLRLAQHDRQRPGPERRGEFVRRVRHVDGVAFEQLRARQVHDQRVIERPAFDRVDAAHGGRVRHVGRETVDRLRRKRDHAAGLQEPRGVDDYRGVDGGSPRVPPPGSIDVKPANGCNAGGMSMPPSARW